MDRLQFLLQKHFGYESFRKGQREVVTAVLSGKDTLAVLPTGTGKSLCYQMAGYELAGLVLIVSPLLSLMQDQVEHIKVRGEKRVAALNSFLTREEKYRVLRNLRNYKFLFLSPEMLQNETVLSALMEMNVALFVIDEAHCISQWGKDFRLDYKRLGEVRQSLGFPRTLALSATATKQVREDITKTLRLGQVHEEIASVDRPNISIFVEEVENEKEKAQSIVEKIKLFHGPGILYFSSRRKAEEFSEILRNHGISKVAAYHGAMAQEDRILLQQQFSHGELEWVCATSAFGMGIHKEDVRLVIHYHFPTSMEGYLQEMGRAGRDGLQSVAYGCFTKDDMTLSMVLATGDLPEDYLIRSYLTESDVSSQDFQAKTQCSEVTMRILHSLREEGDGSAHLADQINEAVATIRGLRQAKVQQVKTIQNWITSTTCRRATLLSYFGESLDTTDKLKNPCCDQCHSQWPDLAKRTRAANEEAETFSWEKRLQALFGLNEKEKKEHERERSSRTFA